MHKIGISTALLTEDGFRNRKAAGIDAIEISTSLERHGQINHKEVLEFSKKYGIELWSYHLPFCPFEEIDISSLDEHIRQSTVELYSDLIKKAADIGIDKFVVHPSGEPIDNLIREERIKRSMQTLDSLAEIADRCGALIAVEDLPRTCLGNTADEMLRLINANDKLRVCFDTNHLLSDNNLNFIKKLSDKIITLHISDYDFIDEKHWLPGEGLVDWNAVYSALVENGYNGVWMYEVGLRSPKTLTRSRDLTFDDIVKNANSIFEGKTPERIL